MFLQNRTEPIAHRDISSKNVMITKHFDAKLLDFGTSKVSFSSFFSFFQVSAIAKSSNVGAMPYTPPEHVCNHLGDLYSFGVLLLEIHTRLFPEIEHSDRVKVANELNETSPFKPLILNLLQKNPEARPSILQVHEMFENFSKKFPYSENTVEMLQNENMLLQGQNADLRQELQEKNVIVDREKQKNVDLRQELQEKNVTVDREKQKIVQLEQDLLHLRQQILDRDNHVSQLEKQLNQIHIECPLPSPHQTQIQAVKVPIHHVDYQSMKCKNTLEGHSSDINCLLLLPNNTIASGSYDNTIKIWNPSSCQCLATLKGHSYPISSLLFLNNSIISGSGDSTIKIWN